MVEPGYEWGEAREASRLQRNYPLVQPGVVVVGDQSSPDKRFKAFAQVTKGFESRDGLEPTIELEPVAKVAAELTFADLLADSLLSASEPLRHNVRGTLCVENVRLSDAFGV